jgi:signal transduction histidine kinase/HD-like signal output (HDOD) protein
MRDKAKKLLQKTDVDKLPSLPHILLNLLRICQDESISYSQIADILRKDPALYVKTLSIYNRSGFHLSSSEQLEQVLQRLSIDTIKSIAVTSTVQQFFSRNNQERTEFIKQYWYHTLLCATIAKSIAKHCQYKYPEEAYTAGLVHDIGQLMLENTYPDKYTTTFAQLSEDDFFHDLEHEEFGTTHQHVGAELLLKHGSNSFLSDAVLYHHEPVENILDAHPLVKITNVANQLSNDDFKEEDIHVFEAAEQLFGLSRELVLEILEESKQQVKHSASEFEIDFEVDGIDGDTARQIVSREQFKHVQLAEQVRNIAMLDGLHQHLSRIEGKEALLKAIKQHIGMLFGISHSILFLYEKTDNTIHAVSDDNSIYYEGLSIPLIPERSLISDSLLKNSILHSFVATYAEPTVIDQQLVRLTDHEGLMCLPLMTNQAIVGALVFGVDETHQTSLWKQLHLLNRFANEIALTINVTTGMDQEMDKAMGMASETSQEHIPHSAVHEVIHEVGNPLSVINNYLEILGYKLDPDSPAQEDIETIKGEILRVSNIINRLTEPSDTLSDITSVDINALITELTNVFKTSLFSPSNIEVTLDLDEHITPLHGDANALKQIYTNLIKNSVEALPTNGEIMVYTLDSVNVDGQENIEISVTDNGPGIKPDILPNLFSPVESTKGGGHAGLGLSIVKKLVAELHGSISCRSSKKGTSFHILLPKM